LFIAGRFLADAAAAVEGRVNFISNIGTDSANLSHMKYHIPYTIFV